MQVQGGFVMRNDSYKGIFFTGTYIYVTSIFNVFNNHNTKNEFTNNDSHTEDILFLKTIKNKLFINILLKIHMKNT